MSSMIDLFFSLSLPVRVLLLNNMGFNIGFYMLLPYLTKYLTGELGYAAGFAGFVMGLRLFSQMGLFLVGGTLADRFNYQSVIVAGCALRVVGFALFGIADGKAWIICAAFMTGFAGALFSPACQALLARLTEGHPDREKVYALQNMTAQCGAFLGPLIGLVLLKQGFDFLCLVAAGVFFVMLLIQWHFLPRLDGTEHESALSIWEDWLVVFRRRDFLIFCFAMSAYYLMFHQLYVLLPLSVPNIESVTAIFTLLAVTGAVLQMPITNLTTRLFPRYVRLGGGLAVMACAFPILGADLGMMGTIPVAALLTVLVLNLGILTVLPPAICIVADMGGGRHQGVYFGVYYFFAGIAGAAGGGATAGLWELHAVALLCGLSALGLAFAALLWKHVRAMEGEEAEAEVEADTTNFDRPAEAPASGSAQ